MQTANQIHIFEYADRQLIISSAILESSKLEVIAVPTGPLLIPESDVSKHIIQKAGFEVERQFDQLRREYKEFEFGMAVFTDAGQLPYSAIVHAISLPQQENPPTRLIEQAYSNSLLLCEFKGWKSIAFQNLYHGDPKLSALAAGKSIIRFWDARFDSVVETVELHVSEEEFDIVISIIEAINAGPLMDLAKPNSKESLDQKNYDGSPGAEIEVGELDLSNVDLTQLNDDTTISDWFGSDKGDILKKR